MKMKICVPLIILAFFAARAWAEDKPTATPMVDTAKDQSIITALQSQIESLKSSLATANTQLRGCLAIISPNPPQEQHPLPVPPFTPFVEPKK